MHGVVPRASPPPPPHLPRQLQCLAKLESTNNFLCMQLFLQLYSLVLKFSWHDASFISLQYYTIIEDYHTSQSNPHRLQQYKFTPLHMLPLMTSQIRKQ